MKKVLFLVLVLFLSTSIYAQSYVDCPTAMAKDTLYSANSDTRYIYFNSKSDSTKVIHNHGSVDIDIWVTIESTVSVDDTVTISAKGIKLKRLDGSSNAFTVLYSDSVLVGTVIDSTVTSFVLEGKFTNWEMYDGIALTFYKGGSDADSTNVYSQARCYKP